MANFKDFKQLYNIDEDRLIHTLEELIHESFSHTEILTEPYYYIDNKNRQRIEFFIASYGEIYRNIYFYVEEIDNNLILKMVSEIYKPSFEEELKFTEFNFSAWS